MPLLTSLAVLAITLCAIGLVLGYTWRTTLGLLGTVFLAAFVLNFPDLTLTVAVAKLVSGWVAAVVLGMGMLSQPAQSQPTQLVSTERRFFRLLSALFSALALFSLLPGMGKFLPALSSPTVWSGVILAGLGLLLLGFTNNPLDVIVGLLTILCGFDLIYSRLESSTLVAGLLAAVNLLLALVGSYLLVISHAQEEET